MGDPAVEQETDKDIEIIIIQEDLSYSDKGERVVRLESPSRTIILTFSRLPDNLGLIAETGISSKNGVKTLGETTALYSRAKTLIQKEADIQKTPIDYQFVTSNFRMANWAYGKGKDLFAWDRIDDIPALDSKGVLIEPMLADKRFFPAKD